MLAARRLLLRLAELAGRSDGRSDPFDFSFVTPSPTAAVLCGPNGASCGEGNPPGSAFPRVCFQCTSAVWPIMNDGTIAQVADLCMRVQ